MERFKDLGLSGKTLEALSKKGFEEPTEIQTLTIPLLLENTQDIIAQAQTGTGKTAAFALPLIENIKKPSGKVEAIILAPTRELVIQVCEEINSLRGKNPLEVAPIYGGQSIELQLRRLKKGVSVVVGTPGRVLDHIRRRTLKLDAVRYFILDEADEMLNMGFIEDIETVLEETPDEKRVLLFSATMPQQIKKLAEKYMGKYTHVKAQVKLATSLTDQIYFEVSRRDKFEALCRIVDVEERFYGMVFCRTRNDVDEVVSHLLERGYAADGLHGEISQGLREKILNKFRKQLISILVATDVAARGIDVQDVTHVINYAIPQNPEAYVHRIGRTGRAGKQGTAITFITPDEFRKLGFIKRVAKVDIRREDVPDVNDIIQARKGRLTEEIERIVYNNDTEGYRKWAKRLIEEHAPEDVLAAVLKHSFGNTLDEKNYRKITPVGKGGRSLVEEEGRTRLFIAKGKTDNMTKKDLADFIVKKAGTPNRLIDDIKIHDCFSFVTVPFAEAENILQKFKQLSKGKKPLVEKAKPMTKSGSDRKGPPRGGRGAASGSDRKRLPRGSGARGYERGRRGSAKGKRK